MTVDDRIYRLGARVGHQLRSGNTLGYGIHSPHLFYIARAILPTAYPYYCFAPIERQRRKMLYSTASVFVDDYGTGSSGERLVRDIARTSLKPAREAQLLMRLAVMLKARNIVELGTSLGISTAYLASCSSDAHVLTFEGAPKLAELAKKNWHALSLKNIECVVGNIDDTLSAHLPAQTVDIAFLDANHTEEATLRYFETLLPLAGQKSIFILDDIHYSQAMNSAWTTICRHEGVSATMDLGTMGLVFFDRNFERKTYRIRL